MIEKAVLTLDFVEIEHHLLGCTVDIFSVARYMEGLGLHNGNHIHIVDPEACLP